MKIEVSAQTKDQVHQLAMEVYRMMIPCFSFDGTQLKRAPSIPLRDTIIEKMIDPTNLIRVQLKYPEDGPDDRWYAACEALLGGGLDFDGKRFHILGGSSSIKKGHFWMATEEVRALIHPFFYSSQEALSYLGVLFSGCHHGIHRLNGIRGRVVQEGEAFTADGMGFISKELVDRLGIDKRQLQVRMVSDHPDQRWLAKGTLLPTDLPDHLDFLLPTSMVKGAGIPKADLPWSFWFGVRDVASTRPYSSSFSFAQWFGQDVLDAVWFVAEQKQDVIVDALNDRKSALKLLGLLNRENEFNDARTKAEAFLQAGVGPDHPWLRRQLVKLMRREYVRLATGGGFELTGRMGAYADLLEDVICACDLPAGPVILSRYPIRDPWSIQAVWNEPGAIATPFPGTVYLNNNLASILDGDFDGDYYTICNQEAAVGAVASTSWYPDYRREDTPPKTRLNDPLSALPFAAVKALGNRIGSLTYAISGAVHSGRLDKVAALSAGLQSEVQSLKWDTKSDRALLEDPDLQMPDYIATTKSDRDLFVRHAEKIEGDFPLIRNYNQVVSRWQKDTTQTSPLVHFKALVPIWQEPTALDCVEEAHAVVQTYNRWIASIIQKNPDPSQDDLAGPIRFLEAWDQSKTVNRRSWAVALWHVVHGSRADTTGSAAFHAFSQELADMMLQQRSFNHPVNVPQRKTSQQPLYQQEMIIPLVGSFKQENVDPGAIMSRIQAIDGTVLVTTRSNGGTNAAFWHGEVYLGQIPKDHLLYSAVPANLYFEARLQLRSRTVYLAPASSGWLTATRNLPAK